MDFGLLDLVRILGALGFFIFGMKIMSDALQLVAGSQMRKVLGTMTTNRYTGVMTGFLITGLLQSSSATTVMTVSFVNAGLISLVESAGVMMGANIGTTITGWLVSLIGFKIKISNYALPIIAIGFPMIFMSSEKTKKWGEVLIGFALLFMGLGELKEAVPDIKSNPEILSFLTDFADPGLFTRLLFVLIGTLLTIVVQSSSAAMTLTIVLTTQGLPLDIAAAMILGENIGTTITAELASLVANVHAKRSARIHSLFNLIGVTWMVILMPWFLEGLSWLLKAVFPVTEAGLENQFALAAFHTAFNLINVILLIGFVPFIVKMSIKTVKSKGEEDEEYRLEFIKRGVFSPSEMSLEEASKEVTKFAEVTKKMLKWLMELSNEVKNKKRGKLTAKIQKFEDISDNVEEQINDFLVKISENGVSLKGSLEIRGLLSIANDLERIADIIYRMSRDLDRMHKNKVVLNKEQRDNLNKLSEMVSDACGIMLTNLEGNHATVTIDTALSQEKAINKYVRKLRDEHMSSVEKSGYDVKAGIIYRDLYNGYERVADHIINVTEGIVGDNKEED